MSSCMPQKAWIGTRQELSPSSVAATILSRTNARMSATSGLRTRRVTSCGLVKSLERNRRRLKPAVDPRLGVAKKIACRTAFSLRASPRDSTCSNQLWITSPPWLCPTSVNSLPLYLGESISSPRAYPISFRRGMRPSRFAAIHLVGYSHHANPYRSMMPSSSARNCNNRLQQSCELPNPCTKRSAPFPLASTTMFT